MATEDAQTNDCAPALPTIYLISDSMGLTARSVARAVAAQFGVSNPTIKLLSKTRTFEQIESFLEENRVLYHQQFGDARMLVLYTLVDRSLSSQLASYAKQCGDILAIDLMTSAIDAMSDITGREPLTEPGSLYIADRAYFHRIEAIGFAIEHDDGRNPQDLPLADIVILGVSRSSKTPVSVYLAQQGFRVANVPLDLETEPPRELNLVDSTRLFGLTTTPEVLADVRSRRLGKAQGVAARYVDIEYIEEDLEHAHQIMRKLGAIVVHTEKRAIEETAQEILRYYERAHPQSSDATD